MLIQFPIQQCYLMSLIIVSNFLHSQKKKKSKKKKVVPFKRRHSADYERDKDKKCWLRKFHLGRRKAALHRTAAWTDLITLWAISANLLAISVSFQYNFADEQKSCLKCQRKKKWCRDCTCLKLYSTLHIFLYFVIFITYTPSFALCGCPHFIVCTHWLSSADILERDIAVNMTFSGKVHWGCFPAFWANQWPNRQIRSHGYCDSFYYSLCLCPSEDHGTEELGYYRTCTFCKGVVSVKPKL